MAVAKSCSVCEETFSSKSNLNRHTNRFHTPQKKKMTRRPKKTQRTNKNIKQGDVQVLNKVLWRLLLQLVERKN